MIAAAELPRVEGRDVGHVTFLLRGRRAARVAPRRGPARAEALYPRLRVAAQEYVGLGVPLVPRVRRVPRAGCSGDAPLADGDRSPLK